LIKLERGDEFVRALVRRAARHESPLIIPSGVLGQVWRDGSRQARLAALLGNKVSKVEALDESTAKAAGALCGRAGTSDVIDASVVLAARLHKAVVVTSDPDDLRRLDPDIELAVI